MRSSQAYARACVCLPPSFGYFGVPGKSSGALAVLGGSLGGSDASLGISVFAADSFVTYTKETMSICLVWRAAVCARCAAVCCRCGGLAE